MARRSAAPGKDAERLQVWQAEDAHAHVMGAAPSLWHSYGAVICALCPAWRPRSIRLVRQHAVFM